MKLAVVCLLLLGCPGAKPPDGPVDDALSTGQPHRVTIDGTDIVYEVDGHGPVCIAVPGGPGFDASYLHDPALEAHFTMVYLDPVGTGGSGKLPEAQKYSIARDVAVLDQIRRTVHQERVCLLGHSYGGFVVENYAVKYPGRITGLILYSTSPMTTDEWAKQVEDNLAAFKTEPWFDGALAGIKAESAAKSDSDLKAALVMEGPLFFTDWAARHEDYEKVIGNARLSYEVSARREGAPFDLREQLHVVKVPVLVVTGDKDFIGGPASAAAIAGNIKGAVVAVIAHAGHFAHLEQPAAFKQAIDGFATRVR